MNGTNKDMHEINSAQFAHLTHFRFGKPTNYGYKLFGICLAAWLGAGDQRRYK